MPSKDNTSRRSFLKTSAVAASVSSIANLPVSASTTQNERSIVIDDFERADSLYHGDGWESLNPGYWKILDGKLRRRLKNYGDRARATGFPYHYETHGSGYNFEGKEEGVMATEYDPSLPVGMIWRRDWKLTGSYSIEISGTVIVPVHPPNEKDDSSWKMYQSGYGLLGICFGGKTLFESYHAKGSAKRPGNACWMAALKDNGEFGIYDHTTNETSKLTLGYKNGKLYREDKTVKAGDVKAGQKFQIQVEVEEKDKKKASVTARITLGENEPVEVKIDSGWVNPEKFTQGYFGIVGRGLMDFEVDQISLSPKSNTPLDIKINDLHACYALGDTLKEVDGKWQCRFVSMFRSDGNEAELRISDTPNPTGGWAAVPVAGKSKVVNNEFRLNTSVIEATLPMSPADATLYYTLWKDGVDVTADPRVGTDAVGIGTGNVGNTPQSGQYVGRLPQLKAPYRICGLSCHAISGSKANLPEWSQFQGNFVRDQPTPEAYQHLDEYDFQVMLWEDDVWYLELVLYTPSTDDAYKIITQTVCGPTSRWQLMRHWNVINPGDHDYGMDDIKGPEQLLIRNHDNLGQDPDYLRRNFQIVRHLITGEESPSGTDNPRHWRRWKMPNRDFSLLVLDSRLWRTSQDTAIWDDQGWGASDTLYSRKDPTRTLLGEEQFAWLTEMIRTDSSKLICLTGINGLHTVWVGTYFGKGKKKFSFDRLHERDRVAADYAGWVSAGCDRVIELLSSRQGVVSVYGDVHNGSILKNTDHRLYECSFGPIGRTGGRTPKVNFGKKMVDYDGRPIEVTALYHEKYDSPDLHPNEGPTYWNFLEMSFIPGAESSEIGFAIRNLIDSPAASPRGGGFVRDDSRNTGRPPKSIVPEMKMLPNADILFSTLDGLPIFGTRSSSEGMISTQSFPDIEPNTQLMAVARDGNSITAQFVNTESPG